MFSIVVDELDQLVPNRLELNAFNDMNVTYYEATIT